MKITAVLLGLLVATLTYAEEYCTEVSQEMSYYIYSDAVHINIYYCSFSNEDESRCENSDNGKILTNSSILRDADKVNFYAQVCRIYHERNATLCEMSARVNFLENTIRVSDNKSCRYSDKFCYDENKSKVVFWTDTNYCPKISFIYRSRFKLWTNVQDQTMFIKDVNNRENVSVSLILTQQQKICGIEVWKTNRDGVVVSPKHLVYKPTIAKAPQLARLQSNLKEFCNTESMNNNHPVAQNTTNTITRRTWYVYHFPTDVTIHICFINLTNYCEGKHFGETIQKNSNLSNQCKRYFYDYSHENSRITICRKTLQVDLEKNFLRGLPSQCKYSEGICKSLNMFWRYTDRCNTIQKVREGYERNCGSEKCVTQKNSAGLVLLRRGVLCGESIWYTNQNGLIASETELQFNTFKNMIFPHENRWNSSQLYYISDLDLLKTLKFKGYFLISILTVCLFWIGFKIAVCSIYLSTKCKKKVPGVSEEVELRRMRVGVNLPHN